MTKGNDEFVVSEMHDNWYQSSSYYVSSFSLITTVAEDGRTSIGPYQLSFPFEVVGSRRSWMVCSRPGSNTDQHVRRTQKCALHFIEYDKAKIETVLKFGYPGQTPAEKMAYNCFELIDSPTPGREPDDRHPQIIKDAYEVYECTLDVERMEQNPILRDSHSSHLLLNIDNILLKKKWKDNLEGGGTTMPEAALTFGFRGASKFWFGERQEPYWLPIPDLGPRSEVVIYEANRLDPEVKFTNEACEQLTGIPRAFLRQALQGIVAEAKKRGVAEIDLEFVQKLNSERDG